MYLSNKTAWPFETRTFQPDQIVLLTDGLCASACSLFVEMMIRAGVKTVVAGGRPATGPMQAASGTRGSRSYDTSELDSEMAFARSIDEEVEVNVNATVPEVRDSAIFVNYAAFNLLDQIRKDEKTPLQFKYEAADCRIYYTLANLYNMTRLWHDVSAAAFEDSSLCVEGSTGFSATNNTEPTAPPKPPLKAPILSLNMSTVEQTKWDDDPNDGLHSDVGRPRNNAFPKCINTANGPGCRDGVSQCTDFDLWCPVEQKYIKISRCLPFCTTRGGNTCSGSCWLNRNREGKQVSQKDVQFHEVINDGICVPTGSRALGCKFNADGS